MTNAIETTTSTRRRFNTIPGISDRGGLPRLGKIRLGMRDSGGKGYPIEVKHFIVDPSDALPAAMQANLLTKIRERYGDEPLELGNVVFVSADRFEAFSENYEWWGGGRMLCQGNGETADRMDPDTGIWSPRATCVKSNRCAQWASGKQCKMIARLRFILPDIDISGYWQLDTGSQYSAANIRDGINMLTTIYGRIHGIPVTLVRAPRPIEYQGKTRVHHIVHMYPPSVTLTEAQERHGAARMLGAAPVPVPQAVADAFARVDQACSGFMPDLSDLAPADPVLDIPEIDVPEDLIATPPERVIDDDVFGEAEDGARSYVSTSPLRIVRYKAAAAGVYEFRTSDNVDHRTHSKSVYEGAKVAKLKSLPVIVHEEAGDDGKIECLHLEIVYEVGNA